MHTNSLPPTDRDEVREPKTVLSTFRTPPTSGNPEGIERRIFKCNIALRDKLRELRDTNGTRWSNSKIANELGCAPRVVSDYLNERGCIYDGDLQKLERNIDDFLRNYERRRVSGVTTSSFEVAAQMLASFERIRRTHDIGAICGPSGIGKTRGIEVIRKENELAMLFTVRAWTCDKNSLLSALWDVIPRNGYNSQTKRAAFVVTSLRGTGRPLIIDDAHKLTRPALHLLFDLYDETNIPICLIGTEELIPKLQDDDQRLSRVGIYWPIQLDEEQRKHLLGHQIKSIATDCNGDYADLLDLCLTVSMHQGVFRSVEKELRQAAELRSTNKKLGWTEAFRQAHTLLLRQYDLT